MSSFSYTGKLAVVTGASAGIGEEFAIQLHGKGAKVLMLARRGDKLDELARQLNAIREDSAEAFSIDLTEDSSSEDSVFGKFLKYIATQPVDILVNNAGRGSFGFYETIDIEEEVAMVKLNIEATMRIAHAVIPGMKERKSGAVVGVSSIAGFQPLPLMATYGATKAFNYSHTIALRYELAPYGVRTLCVCPGPVATEFGGVARVPGKMTGLPRDDAEEVVRQCLRALEKNKTFVIPCLRGKIMGWPSRIFPVSLTTWLTGKTLLSTWKAVAKS